MRPERELDKPERKLDKEFEPLIGVDPPNVMTGEENQRARILFRRLPYTSSISSASVSLEGFRQQTMFVSAA